MTTEDEALLQVMVVVRQSVVPRVIADPLDPAQFSTFVTSTHSLVMSEFNARVQALLRPPAAVNAAAVRANQRRIDRARRALTPTTRQRQEIEDSILKEAQRLQAESDRQRIAACAELYVVEVFKRRPSGALHAVALIRESNDAFDANIPGVDPQGDPLVRALQDPARNGGIRLLTGYVGQSTRGRYTRLYSSLELVEYVDIPTDSIVRTVDLRTPENRLGGAVIWVRVGAELIQGQEGIDTVRVPGTYVSGEIASEAGARYAGGDARGVGISRGWCERGVGISRGWCERGVGISRGWCQG